MELPYSNHPNISLPSWITPSTEAFSTKHGWLNTFSTESAVACGLVTFCDPLDKSNDGGSTPPQQVGPKLPLPIAVRSIDVIGVVVDSAMDVTVSQVFENRDSLPRKIYYVLPLDETVGLYRFEYRMYSPCVKCGPGSREEEKFQAISVHTVDGVYQQAAHREDHSVDYKTSDYFKVYIGIVAPLSIIQIKLGFVQDLTDLPDYHNQEIVINVPNTFIPNYGFRTGFLANVGNREREKPQWNPLHNQYYALHSEYPVKMHFRVFQRFPCSFKPQTEMSLFRVQRNGGIRASPEEDAWYCYFFQGATVKSKTISNIQVSLTPGLGLNRETSLILEQTTGETVALFGLCKRPEPLPLVEIIFLVDQSGSMVGKPLQLVKSVLKNMLREFPRTAHFNVIGFGSEHELFFKHSKPVAMDSVIEQANTYIENTAATSGRNDLLGALETAKFSFSIKDSSKIVIILSDGQVEEIDKILAYVTALQNDLRIFAVAAGDNNSMAKASGLKLITDAASGLWYSVVKDEDIPPCVKSVNSLLLQSPFQVEHVGFRTSDGKNSSIVTNPVMAVDWKQNAKMYRGFRKNTFFHFPQRFAGIGIRTTLKIRDSGGVDEWETCSSESPVNVKMATGSSLLISRLYAQRLIGNLNEQLRSGIEFPDKSELSVKVELIKNLSKALNLMSPFSVLTFPNTSSRIDKWAHDSRYTSRVSTSSSAFVGSQSGNSMNNSCSSKSSKRRPVLNSPCVKELYNSEYSIPIIRDLMIGQCASVNINHQSPDGSFDFDRNFCSSTSMFNYLNQARPRRKYLTRERWATAVAYVILSNNFGVWSEEADKVTQSSNKALSWIVENLNEVEISECIYSALKVLWTYLTSDSSLQPESSRKRQSYKKFYV